MQDIFQAQINGARDDLFQFRFNDTEEFKKSL